ncbi:MAG: phosphohydrolase [Bacteroidetes bacterium]|jgi:HD superfamily phosphohydrolase|nr:phosphohydrolase [Bacteroidota bacterium]
MSSEIRNKRKIINDPIYGFVTIPNDLVYDLINHPYFQRLRRIKQLGMTNLVYPGALHTRFHHAIGAMWLMVEAVKVLQSKGVEITEEEECAVIVAILLHDIGHGPFSHALEHTIVSGVSHEDVSEMLMEKLNTIFKGKLSLAIDVFNNKYKKKFLHQLVSSQLDMDRLDYLKRDSFFTGVSEGVISSDRIIKMLHVQNGRLVIEEKGIYSIEKFIIARRLMYWQVYLHKTVLSAENMLVKVLQRAKEMANKGIELFCSPALHKFLYNTYGKKDFSRHPELIEIFAQLDDYDIFSAIKVWSSHEDKILSLLCRSLINRSLYKIEIRKTEFKKSEIEKKKRETAKRLGLKGNEVDYFVFSKSVSNEIYNVDKIGITILFKDGKTKDISKSSDQLNVEVLNKTVKKWFLCYPR